MASTQELIEAIRADSVVGIGSCSVIDECFSDEELVERFDLAKRWSAKNAVRLARELHFVWEARIAEMRNA